MSSHRIVHDWNYFEQDASRLPVSTPKQAIEQLTLSPIEAWSENGSHVVASPYHPFMAALHYAFAKHTPLILSPDMFWLLIAQGLAAHINENSEAYRQQFVSRGGQATIEVIRDNFIKGSPENSWESVFNEFSRQIRNDIGEDHYSRIVVPFSTTGPIETAANEIVLMDSMKNFYSYRVYTRCSIPRVALEGTDDDWVKLRNQTELLGSVYDVQWWTSRLLPALDAVIDTFRGNENIRFWRNIYKWDESSGTDVITGWILDFFPYLTRGNQRKRNWTFEQSSTERLEWGSGVAARNLPGSLSIVPFLWKFLEHDYPMEFLAGFAYSTQDQESLAIRPQIGWAVRDVSNQENYR